MKDKNADEVIAELNRKIAAGEEITKTDLLPLVLSPLMGGEMSQKERVSAAYDITRKAIGVDAEVIRKVEAVIYIMSDAELIPRLTTDAEFYKAMLQKYSVEV